MTEPSFAQLTRLLYFVVLRRCSYFFYFVCVFPTGELLRVLASTPPFCIRFSPCVRVPHTSFFFFVIAVDAVLSLSDSRVSFKTTLLCREAKENFTTEGRRSRWTHVHIRYRHFDFFSSQRISVSLNAFIFSISLSLCAILLPARRSAAKQLSFSLSTPSPFVIKPA